jgi:two-component system LytT family sensor kinase
MRNVRERMEVLYGHEAEVSIESRPGRGTKVVLLMPILDSGAGPWAELGAVAQVGWGAAMKVISRG